MVADIRCSATDQPPGLASMTPVPELSFDGGVLRRLSGADAPARRG
jgi:hypothetical protein